MVLVVAWGVEGFCFHSDLASRKGSDLRANPTAALLFNWDALGRQVRIEGPVERLRGEESDLYFATRPRAAQLVVRASRQSASIESRAALEAQLHAVTEAFSGQHVPRPATWGGFRLRPEYFELWQHREDRLHDRLAYRRRVVSPGAADVPEGRPAEWELDRLQP
jgi:pyridoxamine 5'-phosphate oxidase